MQSLLLANGSTSIDLFACDFLFVQLMLILTVSDFKHSSIHSSHKYLLKDYCVLGTFLGVADITENKTILWPHGNCILAKS